ncbi:unnamed protein product [Protopolystoma xenopodis]|uniref:Uncharacterized protein n=1 Tax=Protopolystoma xenopodis TaxID=117903 RepID=A0A448XDP8_9PLAT|nr:unnamed protein product [Protopolystoma xenopodis]
MLWARLFLTESHHIILWLLCQLGLYAIILLTAQIFWCSFILHLTLIAFAWLCFSWNAACFYLDYFVRCPKSLELSVKPAASRPSCFEVESQTSPLVYSQLGVGRRIIQVPEPPDLPSSFGDITNTAQPDDHIEHAINHVSFIENHDIHTHWLTS